MRRTRKSNGSIFIPGILLLGGILALFLLFLTVNGYLLQHSRCRDQADALSLSLANSLNVRDRIGQINDLEASSRELVFISRRRFQDCNSQGFAFLGPLCHQLLMESRDGYRQLAAEHKNQLDIVRANLQTAAMMHNEKASANKAFALAWMKAREPQVVRIDIGRIANVESNVRRPGGAAELAELDASRGYIDSRSTLIKSDVNAKLPYNDTDLDFPISSLPACVGGVCSSSRKVNGDVFIRTATIFENGRPIDTAVEQIPSAIQITCTMDASFGGRGEHKSSVNIISSSAATGGIAGTDY